MWDGIKRARIRMNLTQEELSEKSGVSREIIADLEEKKLETITIDTLIRLADALEQRVSDLFYTDSLAH